MHKQIIDNLFYVDSLEGYKYSLKLYNSKKDLIVTDNPFLANNPKTNTSIIDISKLLSQEQGNEIGRNVLLMSNEIEEINHVRVCHFFFAIRVKLQTRNPLGKIQTLSRNTLMETR